MEINFYFEIDRINNDLKTCRDKVVWFLVRHIGCGWASKSCLSLKLHQFSVLCNKRLHNNRIMSFCSIFHPCLQPSLGKKTKGQSSFWLDTDEPAECRCFFFLSFWTHYYIDKSSLSINDLLLGNLLTWHKYTNPTFLGYLFRVPRRDVCLGLLCYTSWVKQSNEAMDFLQTLLKDECFLWYGW